MSTLTVGKIILTNTPSNNDAFDRLRISQPVTLFEISHVFDRDLMRIDEITSGTGVIALNNQSYVQMQVSANADRVVRQSKEYIPYQPGKSRLAMFTGVMIYPSTDSNVTSRIGVFDDSSDKSVDTGDNNSNGHFFQLTGTTLSVVERSYGTDTSVAQSSWNIE